MLVGHHALDDAIAAETARGSLGRLSPRDRAHARAIVATTLRRLGQIDAVLARFLAKGLPEHRGRLREILRTAAAQLLFMGAPAHAVVSIAVTQAKADHEARRYEKLANAVLRKVAVEGPAIVAAHDLASDAGRLNTPEWLWRSWTSAYGEDVARRIAAAHMIEAPLDISVKSDPDRWARELHAAVLPTGTLRRRLEGRIEELAGYDEGGWWVQDCAAALPVRLFGDVRGKRILDLCAAPGGKTAQLAAAGARVTAVDSSGPRLARLAANLARLGLDAEMIEADAGSWILPSGAPPFDAVLLDAPCTATGTIRRHPDIPHLKRADDIAKLAALQDTLLRHAAKLVREGGMLVYCTCSLQPEEGPERIAALLGADPAMRLSPIAAPDVAGIGDWITPEGHLRTLPFQPVSPAPPLLGADEASAIGLDGFFAARLVRVAP